MICCLLLIVFSRQIMTRIFHWSIGDPKVDRQNIVKLQVFRAANLFIIMVLMLNHFVFSGDRATIASKLVGVIMVIFCAFWATQILRYFIRRQFGHVREVDDAKVISDTYNSRLLSLLVTVLVVIVALIGIVQVLGFDSLLEAGGMLGFLGVMLALTQAAWAPDIISGLIILNSGLVEEGDVIEVEHKGDMVAQVFRTKLFHTEFLDIVNNHRVMIKNAKVRDMTICNLSKFASARGLRDRLTFKIGYDASASDVKEMFEAAHMQAVEDNSIPIVDGHAVEIRVLDTGDYAVEWGVFYYTKDVKALIKTRQLFREIILMESLKRDIGLSTPDLYQNALAVAPERDSHPYESGQHKRTQENDKKQMQQQSQRHKQNQSEERKPTQEHKQDQKRSRENQSEQDHSKTRPSKAT